MENRPASAFSPDQTGPMETEHGTGFRSYTETLEYMRAVGEAVPHVTREGEVAVPLQYTITEDHSYSLVPSHTIHVQQPERMKEAHRKAFGSRVDSLYFPQVMRDGRRITQYHPDVPSIGSLQAFDKLGVCCLDRPSDIGEYCWDDHTRVREQYYAECEQVRFSSRDCPLLLF